MLHRLRTVLVRPGRERLVGTVEVDETCIGGRDRGVGRGEGRGDKVLTGIAVEVKEPARSQAALHASIAQRVAYRCVPCAAGRPSGALAGRPKALGLAVPGMPVGSPGMDGTVCAGRKDPYDVLLLAADGSASVYRSVR